MTEPGLTPEEREARVAELQGEADEVMAGLRERMAAVQQAQQAAFNTKGEATSRDGSVRVTVDATGVVTALEFADTVFQKSTPQKLAAATVATIQEAAAQARGQLQQNLAPLTSPPALAAARGNVPGLDAYTVPQVPRTATDPGDLYEAEPTGGYEFDQPEEEPTPPPAPSQVRRPRPAPADDDEDDTADDSIYR